MYSLLDFDFLDEEEFDNGKESNYGIFPDRRSIEELLNKGIIVLDKPAGPTSHEVVSIVKNIFDIPKAGHSGTLDPQVTGVLPIALQSATKFLQVLLNSPKSYICNMFTLYEGNDLELNDILNELSSEIYQVPPLKSNVSKRLRKRRIYSINLLDRAKKEILFSSEVQAGTYIRTLCTDFGRIVGAPSYMKELRRSQTGPFKEDESCTLHDLFDAWSEYKENGIEKNIRKLILPIEKAMKYVPKVIVKDSAINPICHGSNLKIPGIVGYTPFNVNQHIALISSKMELIGLGESCIQSDYLQDNKNGIAIQPRKVIMRRNTYAKQK